MKNEKYFNQERVKRYLELINSINEKAEEKIERIRKQRDEKVDTFDKLIIEEKAKPNKE
tara:strand:- start:373 stop:549 length:177 start_codon:yes stop_codon:yes gene_type:complete